MRPYRTFTFRARQISGYIELKRNYLGLYNNYNQAEIFLSCRNRMFIIQNISKGRRA